MFKRTTNGGDAGNRQQVNSFGRDDARNIIGDVFVGRKTANRSPASYQDVVHRLTQRPLVQAEKRIAMENKSYDL